MNEQTRSWPIVIIQGLLLIGVALAPGATGFRSLALPGSFWDWVASILSGVGLILGIGFVVASFLVLRKTFTVETAVKQNTQLTTRFPFNRSRNPMYLGLLLICFSWSLFQRSLLGFALSLLLVLVLNIKVKMEELNLEKVFGEEYRKYRASVRRFI